MSESVFGRTRLVVGGEELLSSRAIEATIAAAKAEDPDVEVIQLDAIDAGEGHFAEAVGGSLFASHTVVVIRDLAQLPSDVGDHVLGTVQAAPPELCLVLAHSGGAKGKPLLDRLKKSGAQHLAAAPLKSWELPQFVRAEAKQFRIHLDDAAAQALVDAVGNDLRALAGAVAQLSADSPSNSITADMVHSYFAGRAEISSFDVAAEVMQGNAGESLVKLRWALSNGVAHLLITSAMAANLRALGKYLDARAVFNRDIDIAGEIGVPPWRIKELARQSRSWSQPAISAAIRAVAKADARVKGASTDADYALEQMLFAVEEARHR